MLPPSSPHRPQFRSQSWSYKPFVMGHSDPSFVHIMNHSFRLIRVKKFCQTLSRSNYTIYLHFTSLELQIQMELLRSRRSPNVHQILRFHHVCNVSSHILSPLSNHTHTPPFVVVPDRADPCLILHVRPRCKSPNTTSTD